jgi:NADPH:quinone reductase-like Zn-dependent oxidoreductase
MNTLAICNKKIRNILPKTILHSFKLYNEEIYVGLLNVTPSNFNNLRDKNRVEVSVNAFSCNYRDKSLMLTFNEKCEENSNSQINIYSPFGSEFVAVVLRVGENVKSLKEGDRVIPNAAYPFRELSKNGGVPSNYASQRVQTFEESQLIKIPEIMSDEVGSGFTIISQTAYGIIRRLKILGNENILITAATSNTSLAVISALKSRNVNIFAITSNNCYENELFELGVKKVIPYDDLFNNEINKHIGNLYFDIVIDPYFDIYFNQVIKYVNFNGKYIYCGLYMQNNHFDVLSRLNNDYINSLSYCFVNNITIMGNCLGNNDDICNALVDFSTQKYSIIIDSVYRNENIIPFLEKTFHKTKRFGKVIYSYY